MSRIHRFGADSFALDTTIDTVIIDSAVDIIDNCRYSIAVVDVVAVDIDIFAVDSVISRGRAMVNNLRDAYQVGRAEGDRGRGGGRVGCRRCDRKTVRGYIR